MTKSISNFLLLVLFAGSINLAVGQAVPDMIYYRFNGAGSSVPNAASSPVGTNPAPIVVHTQGGVGQFGGALLSGGAGGNVNTGYSMNLTTDWTISFWIDFGATAATFQYFLGDNTASQFRMFANGAAGVNNIVLRKTGFTDVQVFGVADGNPHVVHFVWEAAAGNIKAYKDGVLNNTVAQTSGNITGGAGLQVGGHLTNGMEIGAKMDEFRLYSRALDAAEVQLTWNKELPASKGVNDAGVSAILSPVDTCEKTSPVRAVINNFGINQITTVEVHWAINGVARPTLFYNNLLDTTGGTGQDKDTITLGNITMVGGNNYDIEVWTMLPNNKIDTVNFNDNLLRNVTSFEYPSIFLGNDTTICPGEPITLDGGIRDSLKWNNSSTGMTLPVSFAGQYSIRVYENGCESRDTINVSLFPAPPTVDLGPDTTICKNTNLLLDATTAGVTYLWQNSTTAPTQTVNAAGTYWVNIEDANSCNSGDTIVVTVHQDPSVVMGVSPRNSICFGDPITFTAIPRTAGSIAYQWKVNGTNAGAQTTSNTFNGPVEDGDTVYVELITNLCSLVPYPVASNKVGMTVSPAPKAISGPDTVLENTSALYTVGSSPTSDFLWKVVGGTVDNDSTSNFVNINWGTANPNAKLICIESDNKGCSRPNEKDIVVISIVGIRDHNQRLGLGYAFPNPADHTVTIPVMSKGEWDVMIELIDVSGKQVKVIYDGMLSGNKQITFSVSDLEEGMYFYKIKTADGYQSVKKLTVSH